MLTSLLIENFKGISARQRIDFAPLTLLFGANSAGKSTILQALLYLHEVLERGTADVDRTELGGDVLELGGFARLVHRHDRERSIVVRAEFDTLGSLERFGRDLAEFPFPDLDDDVDSAWIELTMTFRTAAAFRGAIVDRAMIGVNGDPTPLVWLELGTSLRDGEPLHARINLGHALVASDEREHPTDVDADGNPLMIPHAPAEITESWQSIAIPQAVLSLVSEGDEVTPDVPSEYRGSELGANGQVLPMFALVRSRMSALPHPEQSLRVIPFEDDSAEKHKAAEQVRTFLEMVVLGTTAQLAAALRESIYLGPLRAIPPRGFLYERAGRPASWADGLAAWDILLTDRRNRVEEANHWLRQLKAGCQVVVQQLFDRGAEALSYEHVDNTVRRLLLKAGADTFVLPSEVGAGISQVVPVIVAALDGRYGLTLIEQPELHIHPKLQTDLGDLFIVASTRRQFLIETHSEHLILRALRRIRETSAGELTEGDPPFTPDKLSVIYVEATATGTTFKRLRVDESGDFVDRWPHGFFEERAKELF